MRNDFELEILKQHRELETAQHLASTPVAECLAAQQREWGHLNRKGSIREILSRFRDQPRRTNGAEPQPA